MVGCTNAEDTSVTDTETNAQEVATGETDAPEATTAETNSENKEPCIRT